MANWMMTVWRGVIQYEEVLIMLWGWVDDSVGRIIMA